MQPWFIPMVYVSAALVGGLALPRLEQAYLADYALGLSVSSAQAYLSAAASGMMALTGIVFAMGFVMVQFSAIAYSPRLVLWFARDRMLFHALGAFSATFVFALFTLAWVDRGGSGKVPPFSSIVVGILIIVSMLLFSRLMQRLSDLQISNVLHLIGDQGRAVIADMFRRFDRPAARRAAGPKSDLGPAAQTLIYSGKPRTIAELDLSALVDLARQADGTIVMASAVGDTLVEGAPLLRVHGGLRPLPEDALLRAVRLARERTFEQDPKYPIRLLVDVAIKALSPAINDPTTAVQTIDQLEDLLRRLGSSELDAGYATDENGAFEARLPDPDLGRLFDARLRRDSAVRRELGSGDAADAGGSRRPRRMAADEDRRQAVRRYLEQLDRAIETSAFDAEDQRMAMADDRQGIGLSRRVGHKLSRRPAQRPRRRY